MEQELTLHWQERRLGRTLLRTYRLAIACTGEYARTRGTTKSQVMAAIEEAVRALPDRQREAFMLRYWEELDVSETAKAMGCSEGSVKTHCSRATHALARILRSKGITL